MPDSIEALIAEARRWSGSTATDGIDGLVRELATALSAARAVIEEAKAVLSKSLPSSRREGLAILSKFPSGEEEKR